MQLKIRRSNATKGMISKSRVYQTNVMLMLTPDETALFEKYDCLNAKLIRTDEIDNEYLKDALEAQTFARLLNGASFEDNSYSFMFMIENTIMNACKQTLKACHAKEEFNGQEIVIELTGDNEKIVATA